MLKSHGIQGPKHRVFGCSLSGRRKVGGHSGAVPLPFSFSSACLPDTLPSELPLNRCPQLWYPTLPAQASLHTTGCPSVSLSLSESLSLSLCLSLVSYFSFSFTRFSPPGLGATCFGTSKLPLKDNLRSKISLLIYLNGAEEGVRGGATELYGRDGTVHAVTPKKVQCRSLPYSPWAGRCNLTRGCQFGACSLVHWFDWVGSSLVQHFSA